MLPIIYCIAISILSLLLRLLYYLFAITAVPTLEIRSKWKGKRETGVPAIFSKQPALP